MANALRVGVGERHRAGAGVVGDRNETMLAVGSAVTVEAFKSFCGVRSWIWAAFRACAAMSVLLASAACVAA